MGRVKNKIFVADFETSIVSGEVIAWMIKNTMDDEVYEGTNIKSFMDCVLNIMPIEKRRTKNVIFFNNLARFDGHFILKELMKTHILKKYRPINEELYQFEEEQSKFRQEWTALKPRLEIGMFEYFADGSKNIYYIKIRKNKTKYIIFRCSLKLFGKSIATMGELLNKQFGKTIYSKGNTDDALRGKGFKSIEEMKKDIVFYKYLKQDVDIMKYWFIEVLKVIPFTSLKLTQASTAYHEWTKTVLPYLIKRFNGETCRISVFTKADGFKTYRLNNAFISQSKLSKFLLSKLLPVDWINDRILELRAWYQGGITLLHPKKIACVYTNINGYDINSSYPNVMASDRLYPIGEPIEGEHPDYPLRLLEIETHGELINKKGLPFIKTFGVFYSKWIPSSRTLFICEPELERFKRYYKGKYTVKTAMSFRAIKGNDIFGTFIQKAYDIKSNSTNQILRALAKINMNATYGKYGTNPVRNNKVFNPNSWEWESDKVVEMAKYYLPIAIFITAYARMELVDAVGENMKDFIYCDTDSIYFQKRQLPESMVGKGLGEWKQEVFNATGLFRRKKWYTIVGEKTALASVQKYEEISMYDLVHGRTFEKQLRKSDIKCGVFLESYEKVMPPVWEMPLHPDSWFKNREEYLAGANKGKNIILPLKDSV